MADEHEPTLEELKQKYLLPSSVATLKQGKARGHGGFAQVFEATYEHDDTTEILAQKNVMFNVSTSATKEQVDRELEALLTCRHENVLRLRYWQDKSEQNTYSFYTDLLDMTLGDLFLGKKLPETLGIKALLGVAKGLLHLHSGLLKSKIAHLDLKPSNVLVNVTKDSSSQVTEISSVCISDLGACRFESTTLAISKPSVTSQHYSAPETYIPEVVKPTHRADLYSFGIILGEVLTGRKHTSEEKSITLYGDAEFKIKHLANHFEEQDFSWKNLYVLYERCLRLEASERPSARFLVYFLDRLLSILDPTHWTAYTHFCQRIDKFFSGLTNQVFSVKNLLRSLAVLATQLSELEQRYLEKKRELLPQAIYSNGSDEIWLVRSPGPVPIQEASVGEKLVAGLMVQGKQSFSFVNALLRTPLFMNQFVASISSHFSMVHIRYAASMDEECLRVGEGESLPLLDLEAMLAKCDAATKDHHLYVFVHSPILLYTDLCIDVGKLEQPTFEVVLPKKEQSIFDSEMSEVSLSFQDANDPPQRNFVEQGSVQVFSLIESNMLQTVRTNAQTEVGGMLDALKQFKSNLESNTNYVIRQRPSKDEKLAQTGMSIFVSTANTARIALKTQCMNQVAQIQNELRLKLQQFYTDINSDVSAGEDLQTRFKRKHDEWAAREAYPLVLRATGDIVQLWKEFSKNFCELANSIGQQQAMQQFEEVLNSVVPQESRPTDQVADPLPSTVGKVAAAGTLAGAGVALSFAALPVLIPAAVALGIGAGIWYQITSRNKSGFGSSQAVEEEISLLTKGLTEWLNKVDANLKSCISSIETCMKGRIEQLKHFGDDEIANQFRVVLDSIQSMN